MNEKTFERIKNFIYESENMMELPIDISMPLICTMFELMCEKHRLNKGETLARMSRLIVQVNVENGTMYPEEYTE